MNKKYFIAGLILIFSLIAYCINYLYAGEGIVTKDTEARNRAINRNLDDLDTLWGRHIKPKKISCGDISIKSTSKLYLDGGGNTYIYESTPDRLLIVVAGSNSFDFATTVTYTYKNFDPNGAGALNSGTASNYWGDISYKTLTDRGCLGWFDEGVEMPDGSKVSDTEALLMIKKHPTKKTIYGADMLDYKTFPKVAYKKATKRDDDGKIVDLPRDENDQPYDIDKDGKRVIAQDGIEMTSMFSIFIGAIKELTLKNKDLEERIIKLEELHNIKQPD